MREREMRPSLLASLPAPKHASVVHEDVVEKTKENEASSSLSLSSRSEIRIPSYPERAVSGWAPRSDADFGDGGAYPEIHALQYPLGMGKVSQKTGSSSTSSALAVPTVDEKGNVDYSAIVKSGRESGVTVHTSLVSMKEKRLGNDAPVRPSAEEEEATASETALALAKIVGIKVESSKPLQLASAVEKVKPKFVKYTPSSFAGSRKQPKQRIIKIQEAAVDPLEPPKFQHRKVPGGPPDAPVPVLHSPPRKLTKKEKADWKIPAAISNWKNVKGYVIPLDKRLAADGRSQKEVTINRKFATLSEALYKAEREAREGVEMRAAMRRKLQVAEKERKEAELRDLAARARMERAGVANYDPGANVKAEDADDDSPNDGDPSVQFREKIRRERKRERIRDLQLEAAGKKSKTTRDHERDVSERIALGMAVPAGAWKEASAHDARLYNQTEGLTSGFGAEDEYNIYDKPLFNRDRQRTYRPKAKDVQTYARDSVAFEKERGGGSSSSDQKNSDPFGIESFLAEGAKRASAKSSRPMSGTMAASAGGASREDLMSSTRTQVRFTKATK